MFGVSEGGSSPWVSTRGGTSSMSKIGMDDVKLNIENRKENDDNGGTLVISY